LSKAATVPSRKGRPNHSLDFKRRLAQQACEAGVSVSRLAREHGINANMLFKWRRHYRQGLLDEPLTVTPLLPISIVPAPSPPSVAPAPVPASGPAGIEIVFEDCTVRVGGTADMKTLRAVLALLRP
jgi:transposase